MPGVTMAEQTTEASTPEVAKKRRNSNKEAPIEDKIERDSVKKSKSKKNKDDGSPKTTENGAGETNGNASTTKKRKKSVSETPVETDGEASEVPKVKKGKKSKEDNGSKTEKIPKEAKEPESKTPADVQNSKNTDEKTSEEEFDPFSVSEFRVSDAIRERLAEKGIKSLFPIQAKTFDIIYEGGDIVARARTGQGKTLAFVLPILNRILDGNPSTSAQKAYQRSPKVLVLAPTRELAKQVAQDFEYFQNVTNLTTLCVYGGVAISPQEQTLRRGVDIVVGTPGRIKDLIERGRLNLSQVEYRILDEADEMLNMGFVDDVELILGKVEDPEKVQTLLFSATMPDWVNKISERFFKSNKVVVDLVGNQKLKANENIKHYALRCEWSQKSQVVIDVVQCYGKNGRVIVFTETKRDCDELAKDISHVSAFAIHGDISQNVRETTLEGFRSGKFKVLVATDVAARGLDIADVELVVQIEPPRTDETYIHRSGRTGRAGNKGVSVMLFTPKKSYMLRSLEQNCGIRFEHISPPSTLDIVKASSHIAVDSIKGVSDNAITYFQEAAQDLINEGFSPVDLLAKAMAKIAGYSDIKERSLLSNQSCTTLLFQTNIPFRSPLYVLAYLRRIMPESKANEAKSVTMTKDNLGAVFDVPNSLADEFIKASQSSNEGSSSLVKPSVLPDLVHRSDGGGGGYGGGRGGFRGGERNGSGYGRSSGSRGGDRRGGRDRRGGGFSRSFGGRGRR